MYKETLLPRDFISGGGERLRLPPKGFTPRASNTASKSLTGTTCHSSVLKATSSGCLAATSHKKGCMVWRDLATAVRIWRMQKGWNSIDVIKQVQPAPTSINQLMIAPVVFRVFCKAMIVQGPPRLNSSQEHYVRGCTSFARDTPLALELVVLQRTFSARFSMLSSKVETEIHGDQSGLQTTLQIWSNMIKHIQTPSTCDHQVILTSKGSDACCWVSASLPIPAPEGLWCGLKLRLCENCIRPESSWELGQ